MTPFFRTHIAAKILVIALLVAVVVTPVGISISNGIHVQRAQAQMDLGELGQGFVVGVAACVGVAFAMKYMSAAIALMPAGPVPESSAETPVKKALDCILYQVVNTIIEDMINSITVWAQSGFEGNPVFTTQVQQMMLSQLDSIAGAYIESQAPLLCSPFRAQIQLALTQSYQHSSGRWMSSCSLTDVVENVDDFLAGDFYAGGFNGWVEMVSTPYGNPYGAFLETQMGLQLKLVNEEGKRSADLLQGRGFMSKQVQDCYVTLADGSVEPLDPDEQAPAGSLDRFCDEPRTVTPGSFIQEQVGKQLGMSAERLNFADEINEMLTAVISYIIRDMLTGDEGLAGYDPADYADNEYPELPSVDEWPIDPPVGGGGCYPKPWGVLESTPGEPGDREVLNEPATFVSTQANPSVEYDIGMPTGQDYTHVTAEFDMKAGPYNEGGDQYNVFWLHRSPSLGQMKWQANNVAEVVSNNGNGNLRLSTSVNLDNGPQCAEGLSKTTRFRFQEGKNYHITIDYNTLPAGAGRMSVSIEGTDGGGNAYIEQDVTVDYLQSNHPEGKPPGGGFFVVLGGDLNPQGNEGPTYGWEWSNLRVVFEP